MAHGDGTVGSEVIAWAGTSHELRVVLCDGCQRRWAHTHRIPVTAIESPSAPAREQSGGEPTAAVVHGL